MSEICSKIMGVRGKAQSAPTGPELKTAEAR